MTSESTASLLPLLADLARDRILASGELRDETLRRSGRDLDAAAAGMAQRFRRGGRLLVFGSGGSATDADGVASRFTHPPRGPALPATSLVANAAVLTVLANDAGHNLVFSRQLIAMAAAGDIALGISTGGGSASVVAAFAAARRLGLLTVGVCGGNGAAMVVSGYVDHCIVVASDSVHRIQEAQDAALRYLWERTQEAFEVLS